MGWYVPFRSPGAPRSRQETRDSDSVLVTLVGTPVSHPNPDCAIGTGAHFHRRSEGRHTCDQGGGAPTCHDGSRHPLRHPLLDRRSWKGSPRIPGPPLPRVVRSDRVPRPGYSPNERIPSLKGPQGRGHHWNRNRIQTLSVTREDLHRTYVPAGWTKEGRDTLVESGSDSQTKGDIVRPRAERVVGPT